MAVKTTNTIKMIQKLVKVSGELAEAIKLQQAMINDLKNHIDKMEDIHVEAINKLIRVVSKE